MRFRITKTKNTRLGQSKLEEEREDLQFYKGQELGQELQGAEGVRKKMMKIKN